jgi:hypothetical protein
MQEEVHQLLLGNNEASGPVLWIQLHYCDEIMY